MPGPSGTQSQTPGPSGTQSQTMPGPSHTQSHQPTPQKCSSGTARAGIVENLHVKYPSEIWPNIHLVFYPAGSSAKKRKRQATTDPDREPTSSLDSNSSTTVDTSSSEGEDEKDLILPDYPSEELTSSESSDSEPEDASAENLSMGWSETVTRVDTQFLRDHVGPKTSQTTSTTRAPHFPSSGCSSMPNSGGSCATKQSCEPSRSSNPSPLHTMPRTSSPSLSPS